MPEGMLPRGGSAGGMLFLRASGGERQRFGRRVPWPFGTSRLARCRWVATPFCMIAHNSSLRWFQSGRALRPQPWTFRASDRWLSFRWSGATMRVRVAGGAEVLRDVEGRAVVGDGPV
jgi:hypothetical protein